MRMWMVPPNVLCRKHLIGEHVEIHMLAGALARNKSIAGHVSRGQLDPSRAYERHEALAAEMAARGYTHASPLPPVLWDGGRVHIDIRRSMCDLADRCPDCAERISAAWGEL